jgi:hypothetical protein
MKEHAWKSIPAALLNSHRNAPAHFRSTTSRNNVCSSAAIEVNTVWTMELLGPERLGRSVRVEELLKPAHPAVVERDKMDEVRVVRFAGDPRFTPCDR